jgi:chromosome segregation ATPase
MHLRPAGARQWHDAAPPAMLPTMKAPSTTLAALLLALWAGSLPAQSNTKSLGTAKDGGKLLSREQLRGCLAQQQELAARKPPLEAERESLERERQQFDAAGRTLEAERAAVDKLQAEAAELRRLGDELAQKIADFNERARRFQASPGSGPTAQRQQQTLERDKAALDKTAKELDAQRSDLAARAEKQGKDYNALVAQRNQAATDWNARNAQFTRDVQAFDTILADWKADCEGRSYREDDEKALQAGK